MGKAVVCVHGKVGAKLSVLSGGEHWFHTEEQMAFLRDWIAAGDRE